MLVGDEPVFGWPARPRTAVVSVSKIWPIPAAGTPLMIKGLSVSYVPIADNFIVPPFGAFGLT